MLFSWSPEILQSALSTLTEPQQTAIAAQMAYPARRVGVVRARRFGFANDKDWQIQYDAAVSALLAYFAGLGVRRYDDLQSAE